MREIGKLVQGHVTSKCWRIRAHILVSSSLLLFSVSCISSLLSLSSPVFSPMLTFYFWIFFDGKDNNTLSEAWLFFPKYSDSLRQLLPQIHCLPLKVLLLNQHQHYFSILCPAFKYFTKGLEMIIRLIKKEDIFKNKLSSLTAYKTCQNSGLKLSVIINLEEEKVDDRVT